MVLRVLYLLRSWAFVTRPLSPPDFIILNPNMRARLRKPSMGRSACSLQFLKNESFFVLRAVLVLCAAARWTCCVLWVIGEPSSFLSYTGAPYVPRLCVYELFIFSQQASSRAVFVPPSPLSICFCLPLCWDIVGYFASEIDVPSFL